MNEYYVYMLVDPTTTLPFYVGKGKGDRMYVHEVEAVRQYKNATKPHHDRIRELKAQGHSVIYDKVLVNVAEHAALQREYQLIEQYGRLGVGTGVLLNLTRGGQNGGGTECAVTQYSLKGEYITTFPSVKAASEQVPSSNRSYITQCCKGKRVSSGGFLWAYKNDPTPVYTKKHHHGVRQLSLDGDTISEFPSLTEAQAATGVELHNISECCRGKSKTAGGFIWQYA